MSERNVELVPVTECSYAAMLLWKLLEERTPEQSISHKRMPSWLEHLAFVKGDPYPEWYFVECETNGVVGAVYLTDRREVGISIFQVHRGNGYGTAAVEALRRRSPGVMYANINPKNQHSERLWKRLGGALVQHTYEIPAARTGLVGITSPILDEAAKKWLAGQEVPTKDHCRTGDLDDPQMGELRGKHL